MQSRIKKIGFVLRILLEMLKIFMRIWIDSVINSVDNLKTPNMTSRQSSFS